MPRPEHATELSLDGPWLLHPSSADDAANAEREFPRTDFVPTGWLDAVVPGEVHIDLERHGQISGFHFGRPHSEIEWIEQSDWWYRKDFFAPESFAGLARVELVFEGLDTFATVWLNGTPIGGHENMHHAAAFDVTKTLRPGKTNTIVVRLASAVRSVADRDGSDVFSTTTKDRLFARKPQMSYYWDFCGRCVTAGIWRPVRLRGYSGLKIADAAVLPRKISESQADCLCLFEAVNLTKKSLAIAVAVSFIPLTDRTKRAKTVKPKVFPSRVTLKPGHNAVRLPVLIDEPKLWYPRGMGPQDLYMVRWEFKSGKKILAQGVLRTGLRSVELIQEPQPDGGRSFLFSVNGRSFFAKGANWVPPTMRFADITREHYRRLLELAVRGNIAMLRVWGGGIYEHDSFFDLCDELGILVWQDFMFACGIYPQDDSFCELVRAEGDAVIRRLRNHPSLIAWSGDNENDFAYLWAKRPAGSWLENRLTRKVLKDAAGRLDPTRPYLASSPTTWDPECPDPNDKRSGDCHDYMLSPDPDNQNYYKKFAETSPRFESEFGFVQLPGPDSYRRFNPRGLPLFQKSGDNMADGLFEQGIFVSPEKGMSSDPAVVDRFLLETQFFSAEAFRFVIEHYRRLKGTCNGSLYWKFNDPLADNATLTPSQMSCVDMYLKPKMAYYATARAYHAVLLSFKEEKNGTHSLWCVNDTDRALQRTVVMEKHSFGGEKLFAVSFQADIPADASILLRTFTFGGRNDDSFWRASFREDPATEGWCFALDAAGLCRRALPDPGLSIVSAEPDPSGSMVNVTLKARSFAAAVHLDLSGQEETYYSDNDFFLAPGQVRTVLIESPNFQHRQDDAGPRRLTLSCFNSGAGSPQTRLI